MGWDIEKIRPLSFIQLLKLDSKSGLSFLIKCCYPELNTIFGFFMVFPVYNSTKWKIPLLVTT